MKRLMIVAMIAVVAVAFTGCKKKDNTLGGKIDAAVKSAEQTSKDASKGADKTAADLQKKLNDTLKK